MRIDAHSAALLIHAESLRAAHALHKKLAPMIAASPAPTRRVDAGPSQQNAGGPIPFSDFLRRTDARDARPIPFPDYLRQLNADLETIKAQASDGAMAPRPHDQNDSKTRTGADDQSSIASNAAAAGPRLGDAPQRPARVFQRRVETVYRLRVRPALGGVVDALM